MFPPTQVVVSLVTVLPSVLMLFFLLRIITPLTMGAVIAVALVNGLVVLLDGSWLGGKLLDARMPKILATLDDFASLQQKLRSFKESRGEARCVELQSDRIIGSPWSR